MDWFLGNYDPRDTGHQNAIYNELNSSGKRLSIPLTYRCWPSGTGGQDTTGLQPVEKPLESRQMLLDCGRGHIVLLNAGGDSGRGNRLGVRYCRFA